MSDLIKRLEYWANEPCMPGVRKDCADAIAALEAANERIDTLERILQTIANADTDAWDEPLEYEAWAKEWARKALGKS